MVFISISFFNEINHETHYNETAPEIWKQSNDNIDAFVCSAGTGEIIGSILHKGRFEEIGLNLLGDNFKPAVIDEAYKVTDEEAILMIKDIYSRDGIVIGGSSAVNLCGVKKACVSLSKGSNVVTILFDTILLINQLTSIKIIYYKSQSNRIKYIVDTILVLTINVLLY